MFIKILPCKDFSFLLVWENLHTATAQEIHDGHQEPWAWHPPLRVHTVSFWCKPAWNRACLITQGEQEVVCADTLQRGWQYQGKAGTKITVSLPRWNWGRPNSPSAPTGHSQKGFYSQSPVLLRMLSFGQFFSVVLSGRYSKTQEYQKDQPVEVCRSAPGKGP